jgi:hypothetical protein
VTLIAGFKCTDGFVLCADSQETYKGYRVSVQKLVPRRCGSFDLALAGSGNNGDLIDALINRVHDNLSSATDIHTLPDLKKFMRREMLDFKKEEAADFSRDDKSMDFVIGARTIDPPACEAWK